MLRPSYFFLTLLCFLACSKDQSAPVAPAGKVMSDFEDMFSRFNELSDEEEEEEPAEQPKAKPVWTARTDSLALVTFYHATNGQDWYKSDNWLSAKPLWQWHGVSTDSTGRVIRLDLVSNDLLGMIPPELGRLDQLTALFLNINDLTGSIPSELGHLSQLEQLILYGNRLSGRIPAELGNLKNLRWLSLYGNVLTGPIPPELGQLRNLRYLQISGNQFNSSIPHELTQIPRLREIFLGDTLYGCVPPALLQAHNHDLDRGDALPLCQ